MVKEEGRIRKSASLTTPNAARGRIYPTVSGNTTKWVTRDIAALDFLLGIPMEQEAGIVRNGWNRHQEVPTGKWWEKFVQKAPRRGSKDDLLEQPDTDQPTSRQLSSISVVQVRGGGRRLEGDNATKVKIPLSGFAHTRQRLIARQAAIREWELQVAHGLRDEKSDGLLDGRVFFSARDNYPVGVFSVIRYEPKREEAARRRKKLEARGGGGTQFVVPERDWRKLTFRHRLLYMKLIASLIFCRWYLLSSSPSSSRAQY